MRVPLEIIKQIKDGDFPVNGNNVWKASCFPSYILALDSKGNVVDGVLTPSAVTKFKLTRRAETALSSSPIKTGLSQPEQMWVSAFKRLCRNIPKGFQISSEDGVVTVSSSGITVTTAKIPTTKI